MSLVGAGRPLQTFQLDPVPAARSGLRAWQERLRLVQEALTLLRGLSAADLLRDLVLEEHLASSASLRLCHIAAGLPFRQCLLCYAHISNACYM